MSEPVYQAFKRVLKNRGKKTTLTVDGYTNFLFLKKDGTPKVGMNYNAVITGLVKKYNKWHKEQLPNITPHSLRHTFCTRMARSSHPAASAGPAPASGAGWPRPLGSGPDRTAAR